MSWIHKLTHVDADGCQASISMSWQMAEPPLAIFNMKEKKLDPNQDLFISLAMEPRCSDIGQHY